MDGRSKNPQSSRKVADWARDSPDHMMDSSRGVSFWTGVGVAGAGLSFVGLALVATLGLPWQGTADSPYHIDYVYQLSHGNLPSPYVMQFNPWHLPAADGRQFASAHPPLFYALAALVSGEKLTDATWTDAVLRIRLLNVFLGLGTVLCCAWAGSLSTRRNDQAFVVAVAGTAPLLTSFVLMSGDVYNDVLLTFESTLALCLILVALRRGPSWPTVIALSLVSAAGMLTKATFIVVLLIAVGGLIIGAMANPTTRGWRGATLTLMKTLTVVIVPAAAAGWFYARNVELSGAWMRSTPKAPLQHRVERTLQDVLSDSDFYGLFLQRLLGNTQISLGGSNNFVWSMLIASTSLMVLAVWTAVEFRRWRRGFDVRWLFTRLAPVGVLLGMYAAQLSHATGYGQLNIRYLLPALVCLGLLVGGASSQLGRVSGIVTAGTMLMLAAGSLNYLGWLAAGRSNTSGLLDRVRSIGAQMEVNGVPHDVLKALVGLSVIGCALVALSMSKHRSRGHTKHVSRISQN